MRKMRASERKGLYIMMSTAEPQCRDLLPEFFGLQSELLEDKVLNQLVTAEYRVLL